MSKKRFKKIYIEITNCCNLSCAFCPESSRPPHFMSASEFAYILREIKPWTDYIYLHVKGEPLLHPQLEKILAEAEAVGIYVNLTTNGTLLPHKAPILFRHPVRQINISLHSFEANECLPNAMTFSEYIRSAIAFGKKYSPDYGITAFRLWNLDPALLTQPQQEKNRYILQTLKEAYAFEGALDYRNYPVNDARLAPDTFLSFDHEFQWPSMTAPDFGSTGTCHGLRRHLAILCDGTVVPCCLDGDGIIDLGNIFHTPLTQILDSERSKTIVSGFQNHCITEELCRRCGYRTRF